MRYVVVGGGVAGVCCAEELCRLRPQHRVTLVSATAALKGVSVVARLSRTLEELALVERRLQDLPHTNLTVVRDVAAGIDVPRKELLLASGGRLPYDALCICSGARPKQLPPGIIHVSTPAKGPAEGQPAGQLEQDRQQQAVAQQHRQEEQLEGVRDRVLTIRDSDSVARLAAQLRGARHVAVVGNGGIALELIAGLQDVDVTWVVRHPYIGDAFFDLDAAQFLLEELQAQRQTRAGGQQQAWQQEAGGQHEEGTGGQQQQCRQQNEAGAQRQQADAQGQQQQPVPDQQQQQQWREQGQPPGAAASNASSCGGGAGVLGHAVGPRWMQLLAAGAGASGPAGSGANSGQLGRVDLQYGCEVAAVQLAQPLPAVQQVQQRAQQEGGRSAGGRCDSCGEAAGDQPPALVLTLSNGQQVPADLVLLAIGVTPALEWVPQSIERAPDGGLKLNRRMQTSDASIYAAGDAASCQWAAAESPHWFQMRLWSQARSMGLHAAHCMAGVEDQTASDMAFELFTHVTRFMGRKVVLLGLYNGQRLEAEPHADLATYSRVTEGPERTFVRALLLRGRVQGAVMIGETDLEEAFENLIMDQLDVSAYGPELLDPDFELDHVFD